MAASSEQQSKPPYSVQVHPVDALELVKQGASLLVLDMPAQTVLGFDLHMLSVGPLFKGLKMIPPGPHFIYYSPTCRHGANHPFITGFFIHPNPGDVLVRKWDPPSETLVKLSDPDEEERYQAAVRNFDMDCHLGAYDLHHYHTWKHLTSHITPEVIERLEPVAANISVLHEADFADTLPQTPAERRMNQHLVESREVLSGRRAAANAQGTTESSNGHTAGNDGTVFDEGHIRVDAQTGDVEDTSMAIDCNTSVCMDTDAHSDDGGKKPSGRCFYTQFSHLVKRQGVSGVALTMLNVDKSSELEYLLEKQYGGMEDIFLGELEFSFIAFLMGQSLESFGQWKSIVCLMLSCDEAPLSRRTQLFVKFLDIVCFQLQTGLKTAESRSDSDILLMDNSWFSDDNFLRPRFREFYQLVTEAHPVDGDLLKQTRRLKGILESSLGWSFDDKEGDLTDEDDEYAPVIVSETELSGYYEDS
eukprot:c11989_g1_i1 orf=83-1504(+)